MSDTVLDRVVACVRGALQYDPNSRVAPAALLWPDEAAQWTQVIGRLAEYLPIVSLGDYDPATRCGPASRGPSATTTIRWRDRSVCARTAARHRSRSVEAP